jgi:hypothetical protein
MQKHLTQETAVVRIASDWRYIENKVEQQYLKGSMIRWQPGVFGETTAVGLQATVTRELIE